MDYTYVTLSKLSGIRKYLENLSPDNKVNMENITTLKPVLDELKPVIISFIEGYLDLKKHYKINDYYNGYKKGEHSLTLFLSYNKEVLLQELNNFTSMYKQKVKDDVLPKKITDMTGHEFHQYLELIGVLG